MKEPQLTAEDHPGLSRLHVSSPADRLAALGHRKQTWIKLTALISIEAADCMRNTSFEQGATECGGSSNGFSTLSMSALIALNSRTACSKRDAICGCTLACPSVRLYATRNRFFGSSTFSQSENVSSGGSAFQSRASGRDMAASSKLASRTVRQIGPT
jgi:hypothetical protein